MFPFYNRTLEQIKKNTISVTGSGLNKQQIAVICISKYKYHSPFCGDVRNFTGIPAPFSNESKISWWEIGWFFFKMVLFHS